MKTRNQTSWIHSLRYIIPALALVAVTATAYAQTPTTSSQNTSQDNFSVRHQFMQDLTDEQKETLEEIHSLIASGDIEAAQELAEENNLPLMHGGMHMPSDEDRENMDAIRTAIEENDYAMFSGLIGGTPFEGAITDEDKFARLVEAHNLQEQAHTIMEELGVGHEGKRFGRGFHGNGFGPGMQDEPTTTDAS